MKRGMLTQKGFGLVDALIGAAILGVVGLAGMQLTDYATKNTRLIEDAAREPRLMDSMISRTMQNIDNFPGKILVANNSLLDPAMFDDPQYAENMCFTKNGVEIPLGNDLCRFKVDIYRVQLKDSTFDPNGDLAILPMERVYFRVSDMGEVVRANSRNTTVGQPAVNYRYFSKLSTKILVN